MDSAKSNPIEPLDLEKLEGLNAELQPADVESINSQIDFVARAEKSGFLSSNELAVYKLIKQDIRDLNSQNHELLSNLTEYQCKCQQLEAELQKLLDNLITSLERKREEFGSSIEEKLQKGDLENVEAQKCVENELQLVRRFKLELQEGKKAAIWLENSLGQWTRLAGDYALKRRILHTPLSKVFRKYSSEDNDQFYLALEQLIERIIHCLVWGRSTILDVLDIPIIFDWRISKIALRYLLRQARKDFNSSSTSLSQKSVDQMEDYIIALINRLPRYPHS